MKSNAKHPKRLTAVIIAAALAVSLTACSLPGFRISPADGLPDVTFRTPHTAVTGESSTLYTTPFNEADVSVSAQKNETGMTLEAFGQAGATEKNVFCNMMDENGVPSAVLNYADELGGEPCITQEHIYAVGDEFVSVSFLFKTEKTDLGTSGLTIRMIKDYTAKTAKDSVFPIETVYTEDNDRLPTLRVRQFAKDFFTADSYDAETMPGITREEFAALAADGWTTEEIIEFYAAGRELLRGDIMNRNGLDMAFIGYIEDGMFKVRAAIDCGDEYVMLCAEDEAGSFQHVTNALIDTIEQG